MAQEKISFNSALMSLRLVDDASRLSRCDCRDDLQTWDVEQRLLVQSPRYWQPGFFFIRKAGADSKKFVVQIYNARTNALTKTLVSGQLQAKVYRLPASTSGGQAWDIVTVTGAPNVAVDMADGVYYLTVAGLISEPFRVSTFNTGNATPSHDQLLFTLANTENIGDVPYQTGFTQVFSLPGALCAGETRAFAEIEKSERFADRTTYYRQYRVWTLDYAEVPQPLAELLKSLEAHSSVRVQDAHKTLILSGSRISVSVKEDSCCTQTVSIKFEETLTEWGVCQNKLNLTEVTGLATANTGYSDPADTDPTADPYAPDTPPTEPPTDPTVPIAGTILSESTADRDCADPWVNGGISYRTKRTVVRADGSGGETTEVTYETICQVNPASVPVPQIGGLLNRILARVGQLINVPLVDESIFKPASVGGQTPVVTAQGLPAGLTYSGGRLSGTPTATGVFEANLKVTQPGGGSVLIPFQVSTVAALPATTNLNLTVDWTYDADTETLSVSLKAPYTPLVAFGASDQSLVYVVPTATGDLDSWTIEFESVSDNGRLFVKPAGATQGIVSFPVQVLANYGTARNLDLHYTHNPETKVLVVTVTMPIQPEMRLEDAGDASTSYQTATAGANPNTWTRTYTNITQACRLCVREVGNLDMSVSASILIDTLDMTALFDLLNEDQS